MVEATGNHSICPPVRGQHALSPGVSVGGYRGAVLLGGLPEGLMVFRECRLGATEYREAAISDHDMSQVRPCVRGDNVFSECVKGG